MKKTLYVLALIMFISVLTPAYAAEYRIISPEEDIEIPPGMEIIRVGNANVIVPKDTEVYEKKGMLTVESIAQYTSRKLLDIEARFVRMETRQEMLEKELKDFKDFDKELEQVKNTVSNIQKSLQAFSALIEKPE